MEDRDRTERAKQKQSGVSHRLLSHEPTVAAKPETDEDLELVRTEEPGCSEGQLHQALPEEASGQPEARADLKNPPIVQRLFGQKVSSLPGGVY